MWKDVSDEVEIKDNEIIHDGISIGLIEFDYIAVKVAGYKVYLERIDDITYFYIEKKDLKQSDEFKKHEPLQDATMTKFIDLSEDINTRFVATDSIVKIERVAGNKCKIFLKNGDPLFLDYDVSVIKQKLLELDPKAFG